MARRDQVARRRQPGDPASDHHDPSLHPPSVADGRQRPTRWEPGAAGRRPSLMTHATTRRRNGPAAYAAALVGLIALLLLAGCGGGASTSAGGSADTGAANAPAPAGAARGSSAGSLAKTTDDLSSNADAKASAPAAQPAIISTGTVSLRSGDVAGTRFDVQKLVDVARGQISDEETTTDDDGEVLTSRLVLRIPSSAFDQAMGDLEKTARLESSTTASQDVTTRVLDNQVRVRVQRASITRIQALLARAQSIRDIVSIEGQLSRRQASLNSLQRQQAYLADQTSLSTITVSLERTPTKVEPAAPRKADHQAGFLTGLSAGWHGLSVAAVWLSAVVGALLPWVLVALLIAVPGIPLTRRLRARRAAQDATGDASTA